MNFKQLCLYSTLLLTSSAAEATAGGMGEVVQSKPVDQPHFIAVSRHADPISAFLKSALFQSELAVETKYFAGIREKIQDHYTRSSLYREFRSSFINRGIYDKVKAASEVKEYGSAQNFASSLLYDFYKTAKLDGSLSNILIFQSRDLDEALLGGYTKLDSDYQMIMKPNDLALDRLDWNLNNGFNGDPAHYLDRQIAYYGAIDNRLISGLIIKDRNKAFSLHQVVDQGQSFVAVLRTDADAPALCNRDLRFYHCEDVNKSEVETGLAAILSKEGVSVPQSLFDSFSKILNDSGANDIFEDAAKKLSDDGEKFYVETPFVKKVQGQAPLHLMSQLPQHKPQNDVIEKDASYFPTQVKDILYSPSEENAYDLVFKFPNELRLVPGESIYLVLPARFSAHPLANVILGHRQNPRDQRGSSGYDPFTGSKTYDQYPAYTSVQVHSVVHAYKDSWRTWGGPVSSDKGSKFAEIRKGAEFDNLYEWPLKGHKSLRNERWEDGSIDVDMVKIEALGDDPVYLDSVTVKVIAPKANNYVDISYTRDRTSLGDPITFKGRRYGGGQSYRGTFPGAQQLSPSRWRTPRLAIPVNGKKLKSVSVAVGDTKPDGVRNQDGGMGSLGAAKISIIIEGVDGSETVIVDRENVGPQGVISGYTAGAGIEAASIIIKAHQDTAYIMGIQYGHD